MKFHSRMSLLALILFIPLIIFSYLFISEEKKEIVKIQNQITGSQLNNELISLVHKLQYHRGSSCPFEKDNHTKELTQNNIDAMKQQVIRINQRYHSYKKTSCYATWKKIEEIFHELLKASNTTHNLAYFQKSLQLIEQIHRLIEDNQILFQTILHKDSKMHTLEKVIFESSPYLLEDIAVTRGLLASALEKKELDDPVRSMIYQRFHIMQARNYYVKQQLTNIKIDSLDGQFNPNNYSPFKEAMKQLEQRTFNMSGQEFFYQATQILDNLSNRIQTLYPVYAKNLQQQLDDAKDVYSYLIILLVAALSLALYLYFAIFTLARISLRRLKIGTQRFSRLNYNHEIVIESNDEFAEIAHAMNEIAHQLKFDVDIIDKYIPISKTNRKGIITEVNRAFCKLTGYSPDEIIGHTHAILKHPDNKPEYFKKLWKTILSGDIWDAELLNKSKHGDDFWVQLHIIPIKDKNKSITGFISMRKEITEKKKAQKLAITDELTGLYNRKHLNLVLDNEIDKAKRYENPFSIIMIDIDYFKAINDTFGHPEGDLVLKNFATLVTSMLRISDTFARWGGEEFIILLPHTTLEDATKLAETIRITTENFQGNRQNFTISAGVTTFDPYHDSKEQLISRCDSYLYKAKQQGRNHTINH